MQSVLVSQIILQLLVNLILVRADFVALEHHTLNLAKKVTTASGKHHLKAGRKLEYNGAAIVKTPCGHGEPNLKHNLMTSSYKLITGT